MKLKDAIQQQARMPGTVCTIRRILDNLDPLEAVELFDCLKDRRYTNAQIARALTAEGHPIRTQTVQRHRSGECNCAR